MYCADTKRYDKMVYNRCGRIGLLLPAIFLGMWQNFGLEKPLKEQKQILFKVFDLGPPHFDLANNYRFPARGLAEEAKRAIDLLRANGTPCLLCQPMRTGGG